ncbi:MAG: RNA methyltransferase [Candidatus Nanohalobium sp.]
MDKIVLVEPETPENTGFIARLASNYKADLRLIKPEFNLKEARETAANAQNKLREARIFQSTEKAVEDIDFIVGTKPGKGITVKEFQPRENTSVMIGRESRGLSNRELELCDATVHINPPGYSSLNQSHAAAIMLHELSKTSEEGLGKEQKKALSSKLEGLDKLRELVLRGSPTGKEFNRLMGELEKQE